MAVTRGYYASRERNRAIVRAYLLAHPCEVCGESDLVVLQFHHPDPSPEDRAFHQLMTASVRRLEAEMAKCRVLCANDHLRVHAAEGSLNTRVLDTAVLA
jgi:hypothetical protein